MKSKWLIASCLLFSIPSFAARTTLIQAYEQALTSDPIYQQAIAQRLSDSEAMPLNIAPLLPQASITGGPALNKQHFSSSGGFQTDNSMRSYVFTLNLSQAVFDYGKFVAVARARMITRKADATLNAASQSLMIRVANAYFAVLKDEENLSASLSTKKAFAKQLEQITQQHNVGLKTMTDVYTAKASYATAYANTIAAETQILADKENLRVITGHIYTALAPLSENFPLISPQPNNMEKWVSTALQQNWSIKAAQFTNVATMDTIKQARAGHYPTVYIQGSVSQGYNSNFAGSISSTSTSTNPTSGSPAFFIPTKSHTTQENVSINLGMPIFAGGGVIAQTDQAKYNYQVSTQHLEEVVRNTENSTRQSYLNILASIQKIRADKQAVFSSTKSYEGLEERYHAGAETLVNVINQQENVYNAKTTYAADRFTYVNNLLALKQAAGTLSQADLMAINGWLTD